MNDRVQGFMMNLGDVKGSIVKKEVTALKAPRLCIEFGGYCGYSAILIGSTLPAGCKFISIEINPVYAALATKLVEFAGLKDRVTVMVADVPDALKEIRSKFGAGAADFVFIDHWKTIYLRDMKNLEASGLLRLGSVVVADNILYPGAPDYLEYVQTSKRYRTVLHKTLLEYHTDREDAVAVSTVVGDSA
jgi:catechol O-methyltransferase